MTKGTNDGGAAFPCEGGEFSGLYAHPGMTLRDYFAAAALQGILAKYGSEGDVMDVDGADMYEGSIDEQTARNAYSYADAMIKARSEAA